MHAHPTPTPGHPIRVAVLGSTGSIGRQALDVAAQNPDLVKIVALSANSSVDLIARQAEQFDVQHLAMGRSDSAAELALRVPDSHVGVGADAVEELTLLDDVDIVLNALVGAAGLRATVSTLRAGRRLALANKESLVVGGELVTSLAKPGMMTPVDSEHSAIYQCLLGEDPRDASRIWLTASGGPFRGRTRDDLASVTAQDALKHPNWVMGPKISIDSATLMNKGLEAIEAHHLFGMDYDRIRIVVHPQSCIHSMVEFSDGSVIAHLGATDMRIPIQFALSEPRRWSAPVEPVDFTTIGQLDFENPDLDTFKCLAIALQAGRDGGTTPVAMNAANEVAVAAFLKDRIGFTDVDRVVSGVLDVHKREVLESIEQVEEIDMRSRESAESIVEQVSAT
ncbi:MAG: 1-deoxy-D-xylulose-5-phosphate reductoisomerase [Actinomycetota bacterium]|jgi:1-deoxy-D-xylulose-5-phosphate reductoisomerase|nr:1-deoxy-D-xylulose-5-phosphate reductoisomerase [Actinomycetota bacterium]